MDPKDENQPTDLDFEKAFNDLMMEEPKGESQPDERLVPVKPDTILKSAEELAEEARVKAEADAAAAAAEAAKTEMDEAAKAAMEHKEPEEHAAPAPFSLEDLTKAIREGTKQEPPQRKVEEPRGPQYTAEETAILQRAAKDWPDIMAAQELQRREEYQQLTKYIFSVLDPVLSGLRNNVTQVTAKEHTESIYKLDPDYDQVRDPVVQWALSDQHPAYLKKAYENVVQNGSPQEIHHLIGQWRAAQGQPDPAAAAAAAAAKAAADQKAQQEAAKKAAAKSMAPTNSKRSGVAVDAIDPSDYDAAFANFESIL